jgi:hypothetical protein
MRVRSFWIAAAGLLVGSLVTAKYSVVVSKVKAAMPDQGAPTVQYTVAQNGAAQRARFFAAKHDAPLIVDLHQWSGDEKGANGEDERFDLAVQKQGWNFVRPNLENRNDNPRAYCSDHVMAEINGAIDYAKRHAPVDPKAIYIVGESGGAYTALCGYMSGKIHATAFYAWAPITDLQAWNSEHPSDRYGRDVAACTGSTGSSLNIAECRKRSPMTMGNGQPGTPLFLFAGVHDGSTGSVRTTGSVPFSHSVRLFNLLADKRANGAGRIDDATMLKMSEDRIGPDTDRRISLGGRRVHLYRQVGLAHLAIFEGEHEMLSRPTVNLIAANYRHQTERRTD